MEKLKNSLDKEKQYLFKCSQCEKMIDLSGQVFYCNNCKSNYCEECLKGHNEIFFDHEIHKTNEETENEFHEGDKSSLLANPDLDLDDRVFSDTRLPEVKNNEYNNAISDINILFNETMTSIQEMFNEEICKLRTKKSKEEKNDNENKIIEKDLDLNFELEKLRAIPPLERMQKIMEILKSKNNVY